MGIELAPRRHTEINKQETNTERNTTTTNKNQHRARHRTNHLPRIHAGINMELNTRKAHTTQYGWVQDRTTRTAYKTQCRITTRLNARIKYKSDKGTNAEIQ